MLADLNSAGLVRDHGAAGVACQFCSEKTGSKCCQKCEGYFCEDCLLSNDVKKCLNLKL